MSLRPYPNLHDSRIEWLGEIPSHWEIVRLGALFQEVSEEGCDGLPILSVSIHQGVSDKELSEEELDRKVSRSEDTSKYIRVQPGDLVYNMMRAWQGGFGSVSVAGMVSPAYVVARPRKPLLTSYIEMLLRTPNAVEQMRRLSKGVTDFRLRLYWDEFKSLKVALPPIDEQKAMADYLDRETAKIDALVAEQERLIALLAEKRRAVISHAVTKGLDPNALMKDSGIEWLGEIPAHWDIVPLKHLVTFKSGGTPSKNEEAYWGGEFPWASAKDLKNETISDTALHLTDLAFREGVAALVDEGSVLVVVRGMILARTFPVCLTTAPMAINQDLKAVQSGPRLSAEFLAWSLRGTANESLARLDEAGHGTKALRMEAWSSLPLAVAPLSEQGSIVAFLARETARLDTLTAETDRAIALLKERRAALISAAVTGKIDVRDAVDTEEVAA